MRFRDGPKFSTCIICKKPLGTLVFNLIEGTPAVCELCLIKKLIPQDNWEWLSEFAEYLERNNRV